MRGYVHIRVVTGNTMCVWGHMITHTCPIYNAMVEGNLCIILCQAEGTKLECEESIFKLKEWINGNKLDPDLSRFVLLKT